MSSRPSNPNRGYAFSGYSTNAFPGQKLDQELDRTNAALAATSDWMNAILADDGTLRPEVISKASLTTTLVDEIKTDVSAAVVASEANAAASEANAAASATTASTKATEASTSATNAANSATTASTKATEASTSATNAANSAANASTSAANASTSAANAATSETNAANSASTATTKATLAGDWAEKGDGLDVAGVGTRSAKHHANQASTSAANAANSATNAANSATAANTSATNAGTSETNAANSATAAAARLDEFDDRYLGAKAAEPALDNDGNALLVGALYWDTTLNKLRTWTGTAWISANTVDDGAIVDSKVAAGAGILSSKLAHTQGFANATPRTVAAKLGEVFTPLDFGATGDGVADDTAAFTRIMAASAIREIDGLGKTYRMSSTVAGRSNITIRNCIFDISPLTYTPGNPDAAFEFFGSVEPDANKRLLTADASKDGFGVTCDITGISRGDWCIIRSSRVWENNTNSKQGENILVLSASAGQIITRYGLRDTYRVATDAAWVKKVTPIENVHFADCKFIGGGDGTLAGAENEYAIRFLYARHCTVSNHESAWVDHSGVEFNTCYDVHVLNAHFENAQDEGMQNPSTNDDGFSYGVAFVNGCEQFSVLGSTFLNMRHGITTGGYDGINRIGAFIGNTLLGCRAGAIDTHPSADEIIVADNFIDDSVGNLSSGSQNGLQLHGGSFQVSGNIVNGSYHHGITIQAFALDWPVTIIVANNKCRTSVTGATNYAAIFVSAEGGVNAPIASLSISGNTQKGWGRAIQVWAKNADVEYLAITGNALGLCASDAIYLLTTSPRLITNFTLTGNSVRTTTSAALMMIGGAVGAIKWGAISGNVFRCGTGASAYAIRGSNTEYLTITGNTLGKGDAAATYILADGTNTVANNTQQLN